MNYIGKKGVRREWEERRTNTWAEPQCSTCWLYLWTCFQFPALLKSSTANATPRPSKYTLPCPVDGMSFKYSYKVKVFCNIDATDMVSACPSSPGRFPEPVLWECKFPLQFLIWISPLRGPKTFPNQKLLLSILARVTQSIQNFSQTTFLIRRSWDRCWISLPSKLRVLLPFYIP